MSQTQLLLTAVFKPYGVKDEYAEELGMEMELFHCQLTRRQGVHSPRANYWSYALYLLAENVSVPATVLDFPEWEEFVREVGKGYTHVGISFSGPNVYKARRMAEHIRRVSPETKIIVGGYGAGIPELRDIVPCDEVCPGDGIRWMREYFGEDPEAPVRHPILHDMAQAHMYGVPLSTRKSAVLFPGLGCNNACFFCATSNKFGRYIPLVPDGRKLFEVCRQAEEQLGARYFTVQDENFLNGYDRVRQMEAEMERHGKPYRFFTFSSAESVNHLGIDFLVRLGVTMVWMGVESRSSMLRKTQGIDLPALIRELRANGISVIASTILFLEHHDKASMEEDVNWAIGLEADVNQFLQLMPVPGTPLFNRYRKEGKLWENVSYPKLNGQNEMPFRHSHFTPEEAISYVQEVSMRKYRAHGPSTLSMAEAAVQGYQKALRDTQAREGQGLVWNAETLRYEKQAEKWGRDKFMQLRLEEMRKFAGNMRPFLPAMWVFSPNAAARRKAVRIMKLFEEVLGRASARERVVSAVVVFLACMEVIRRWGSRMFLGRPFARQPPSCRIEYRR